MKFSPQSSGKKIKLVDSISCSCARVSSSTGNSFLHLQSCENKTKIQRIKIMTKDLAEKYKQIADKFFQKPLMSTFDLLNSKQQLQFNMDSLGEKMELGMAKFISKCHDIQTVTLWSSLVALQDIEELLKSTKLKEANLVHATVQSFYQRAEQFNLQYPKKPNLITQRNNFQLSLNHFENEKLIKAISLNLYYSQQLTSVTICGMNIGDRASQYLNRGLLKASKLKKLRLNLCMIQRQTLANIMPALTSPGKVPLEMLDLSANGMKDDDFGQMIAKIIAMHAEFRDQIFWLYGLRNELPPNSEVIGIKQLDVSYNKLGANAAYQLSMVLKNDQYLKAINLRSNQINEQGIETLLQNLQSNQTLMNVDLRDNLGFKMKQHRKLAVKLLETYTYQEKKLLLKGQQQLWLEEQQYFDQKLLVVQIPPKMVKTYARKLEQIRTMCLSPTKSRQTPKFKIVPSQKPRNIVLKQFKTLQPDFSTIIEEKKSEAVQTTDPTLGSTL